MLVACEESQAVTKEFRSRGFETYSCDIVDCSGGHPEWHIKEDVLPLLNGNCTFKTCDGVEHTIDGKWDAVIAFPPFKPLVGEQPELEWFEWVDKKTGKMKRQPKWFADAWHLPAEERAKIRSKTFPSVAKAMAEQWGKCL